MILQVGAAFVPLLLVLPMTSGYVAWILVRLPPEARRNKEALMKWVKNIPSDTLLEIKTVRANGFGRATDQCTIQELRPHKPKFLRGGNYERVVERAQDKRRTGGLGSRLYAWMTEPPRLLKIADEEGLKSQLVKAKFVWPEITRQLGKITAG
jgi:hypothetical protein